VGQWFAAVAGSKRPTDWTVHAPPAVADQFHTSNIEIDSRPSLSLEVELRFHAANDLHRFVAGMLATEPRESLADVGAKLAAADYHLRITRSLATAKNYLRSRYTDNPDARYGLLASARDRDLEHFGVPNDYLSTMRVKHGPWYGDAEDASGHFSCRHLEICVTEFGAQGLELDAALLAWGTDLVMTNGTWSNANSRGYQKKAQVRDALQLRLNAYRVLLTRGRDGCVVFVPELPELDETFNYLANVGFKLLTNDESPQTFTQESDA